jgi:hypothetical protein
MKSFARCLLPAVVALFVVALLASEVFAYDRSRQWSLQYPFQWNNQHSDTFFSYDEIEDTGVNETGLGWICEVRFSDVLYNSTLAAANRYLSYALWDNDTSAVTQTMLWIRFNLTGIRVTKAHDGGAVAVVWSTVAGNHTMDDEYFTLSYNLTEGHLDIGLDSNATYFANDIDLTDASHPIMPEDVAVYSTVFYWVGGYVHVRFDTQRVLTMIDMVYGMLGVMVVFMSVGIVFGYLKKIGR